MNQFVRHTGRPEAGPARSQTRGAGRPRRARAIRACRARASKHAGAVRFERECRSPRQAKNLALT